MYAMCIAAAFGSYIREICCFCSFEALSSVSGSGSLREREIRAVCLYCAMNTRCSIRFVGIGTMQIVANGVHVVCWRHGMVCVRMKGVN